MAAATAVAPRARAVAARAMVGRVAAERAAGMMAVMAEAETAEGMGAVMEGAERAAGRAGRAVAERAEVAAVAKEEVDRAVEEPLEVGWAESLRTPVRGRLHQTASPLQGSAAPTVRGRCYGQATGS
jgi:hypothetical protein